MTGKDREGKGKEGYKRTEKRIEGLRRNILSIAKMEKKG
jgi:hypothetical protein